MFSPTLALDVEPEDVKFPCHMQEKHNGVRFEKINGQGLTRTLKPIPNNFIRSFIEAAPWNNLEGEILINGATTVNEVTSAVMSVNGQPDFHLVGFDVIDQPSQLYELRHAELVRRVYNNYRIRAVENIHCPDYYTLKSFISYIQNKKGEGVIIRYSLTYKNGRSSATHPGLLRHVPHRTTTATIISCEELCSNQNDSFVDELGRTKRSKHQANLVPMGTLGAFLVTSPEFPKPFRIGTGFSEPQRQYLWDHRDMLPNRQVMFEYKPSTVIDVPAPAVFKYLIS